MASSKKHIGFYITNSLKHTIELPLTPPEIKWSYETDDETVKIINLGEVNKVGNNKLRTIEISSTFPWWIKKSHLPNANKLYGETRSYVNYLKNIVNRKKPVRVVVSNTSISMQATLQKFEYGFENAQADTYAYSLKFVEYKKSGPKKIKSKKKKKKKKK
ncbi:hypothetical protein GSH19_05215 [Lactobacillus sp. S2-2]|uniref:hypothetical protein n=1 Tax=Lactobacillus sp. S2-2 TaxID=2692917 RepID=UPI001F207CD7|nr:hypothetical protein [Lactobacillus sp. S2-2]MCF6515552.1 hypothetical protein [Lactobacillus sp. S2-2]